MNLTKPSREMLRNPLVLPFYFPALIMALTNGILLPVVPLYAKTFSTSYGMVGLMLAGAAIGALLADIPSGLLQRRLGSKNGMLVGLGCTILFTLALSWARSAGEVVVYQIISGMGASLYGVSRHTYISKRIAPRTRGRVLSLCGGMMRIGRFVGPVVGGAIAATWGMRVVFIVVGILGFLAPMAITVFMPSTPIQRPAHTEARRQRHGSPATALKGRLRLLAAAGLGQLLTQTIRSGRQVFVPLFAADVLELDIQSVGLMISIAAAIEMSMFYPAGLIMDRHGRKAAIIPSLLIQALGLALMPFASGFAGLTIVASLAGLGNGLSSGAMLTLGADLAPEEGRGTFLGMWRFIGDSGGTTGPIISGTVADLFIIQSAAWVIAAAGFLAAATFAFLVPETLKTHPGRRPFRPSA